MATLIAPYRAASLPYFRITRERESLCVKSGIVDPIVCRSYSRAATDTCRILNTHIDVLKGIRMAEPHRKATLQGPARHRRVGAEIVIVVVVLANVRIIRERERRIVAARRPFPHLVRHQLDARRQPSRVAASHGSTGAGIGHLKPGGTDLETTVVLEIRILTLRIETQPPHLECIVQDGRRRPFRPRIRCVLVIEQHQIGAVHPIRGVAVPVTEDRFASGLLEIRPRDGTDRVLRIGGTGERRRANNNAGKHEDFGVFAHHVTCSFINWCAIYQNRPELSTPTPTPQRP